MSTSPPRGVQRTSLPELITPLVGRDKLLHDVLQLLSRPDVRLLTLRGEGGIGKTALAVELAHRRAATSDLVTWVDLTQVCTPDDVLPHLARALGCPASDSEDPSAYLGDSHALIVLDNFEHVHTAAEELAHALAVLPNTKLLVTSRVPLNLTVEHLITVGPLAVTPADHAGVSDAARLFERLARQIEPHFTLDDGHLALVEEVCRRLDGVPLAVELAAARLRAVSLATLVTWLDRPLDLLRDGPRDRPARSRAYLDAVEWSCALLTDDEREVFRACGAFVGGFTLDALQAALPHADLPHLLTRLAEHSLVRPDERRAGRFFMLEPVRAVAHTRLLDSPTVESVLDLCARHFLQLARDAAERQTDDPAGAWSALDADDANFQASLVWFTLRGRAEEALRLCEALSGYWQSRAQYTLALRFCRQAAELPGAEQHPALRVRAELTAAMAATRLGQFRLARELGTHGLDAFRTLGDVDGQVDALMTLGVLHHVTGDLDASVRCDEEALALLPVDADPSIRAVLSHNIGTLHAQNGHHDEALSSLGHAQTLFERDANSYGLAHCHMHRAWVFLRTARLRAARPELTQGLQLARQIGDVPLLIALHDLIATYALRAGQSHLAVRVLAAADAYQRRTGERWNVQFQGDVDDVRQSLRTALPDAVFEAEWLEGEAASFGTLAKATNALLATEPHEEDIPHLTSREREVLRHIAVGQSDKQIARTLGISVKTANRHVANLFGKTDARNRVELTRWAIAHDLLRDS
ncbi:LuxR C-terminal-related transcriptional regulator [Deinococcus apachensis]|uniref:LuxR C-terminal-related transcriptional regulator n=1 Tax=Deinococcus apachensis TaxID=309886 RepID=UPI0003674AAC|nr:LuxR C-terminal-related transcriptional regulator [Deinococcus apachensis]